MSEERKRGTEKYENVNSPCAAESMALVWLMYISARARTVRLFALKRVERRARARMCA